MAVRSDRYSRRIREAVICLIEGKLDGSPDSVSVSARPLDMTHPLATWVIGTRLRTLTSGAKDQERRGTIPTPSDRCAEASPSRLTTRAAPGLTTVISDCGAFFREPSPA